MTKSSTSCWSTTSRATSTRSRPSWTTRRTDSCAPTMRDEALRLLLDNDVAAIVLDIQMPGVSGFELAQIIKGTQEVSRRSRSCS